MRPPCWFGMKQEGFVATPRTRNSTNNSAFTRLRLPTSLLAVVLAVLGLSASSLFANPQPALAWNGNATGAVQWALAQVGQTGWITPDGSWQA